MLKKPRNGITPFCQTIKVVMSPKGEKAPPAFAATTMLIQAKQIKERTEQKVTGTKGDWY